MIIKNIQALRAIAANGVLISHLVAVEQQYSHGSPVLSANAHAGAFGVDLFFVISGFIMVTIARNASWRRFLFDRAMRIFPPYWFYTTLVLIASFYINISFYSPPSVWRSYLLIPYTVDPLLFVGWTLIHEMYFYLCFALIIFLTRSRTFTITSLLLTWAVAIICFYTVVHRYERVSPIVAIIVHPLTLEFIFGAVVAILIQKNDSMLAPYTLAVGTILFIAIVSLRSDALGSHDARNWQRPMLVGAACALIVYGLVGIEIKSKLTAPHWLVVLGNASYSTYLCHSLVQSALGKMFAHMSSHNIYFETAFVITCIITANIVGLLSYNLIERRPYKRASDAIAEWRLVPSRVKPPLPS